MTNLKWLNKDTTAKLTDLQYVIKGPSIVFTSVKCVIILFLRANRYPDISRAASFQVPSPIISKMHCDSTMHPNPALLLQEDDSPPPEEEERSLEEILAQRRDIPDCVDGKTDAWVSFQFIFLCVLCTLTCRIRLNSLSR